MKTKRYGGCLLLAFMVGLPVFFSWNFLLAPMLEWKQHYGVFIGAPATEVVKSLGEPSFKMTPAEVKAKGVDYPWRAKGYMPIPERRPTGEVWLFEDTRSEHSATRAIYVFLTPDKHVDAIEFAGR